MEYKFANKVFVDFVDISKYRCIRKVEYGSRFHTITDVKPLQ